MREIVLKIQGQSIAFHRLQLISGGLSPRAEIKITNTQEINIGDSCFIDVKSQRLLTGIVCSKHEKTICISGGDYNFEKKVDGASWQESSLLDILSSYELEIVSPDTMFKRFSYGDTHLGGLCALLGKSLGCVYYFDIRGCLVFAPKRIDLKNYSAHFVSGKNIIRQSSLGLESFAEAVSAGCMVYVDGVQKIVRASRLDVSAERYRSFLEFEGESL